MATPAKSSDECGSAAALSSLCASGDAAYEWDLVSDAIVWSGPAASALGLSDIAVVETGRQFSGRINPEDLPLRQHALNRHLNVGDRFDVEYRVRSEDGSSLWMQDRAGVSLDPETGRPLRLRGILRPITTRKQAEARLERLAHFDELTGHFNKARLRDAIEHVVAYGDRQGIEGAYLAIGIDNVTMVNDAFGHEAADAVICEVGRRLDRALGINDIIGRVGGDRFGLLLGSCPPWKVADAADRIITLVRQTPIATNAGPIYVTVSIGTVSFPSQAQRAQDIMTRAETALAAAKRAGRDCVVPYRFTEEHRAHHRAGMAVGERVRRALAEGRIVFAYQPVVTACEGTVDYYECLLRMIDETDGRIVPAGEFISQIEQLGFVRVVDRYVLLRAVNELNAYPQASLGINISALTASDRTWLSEAQNLLAGRRDLAKRLVVEITETAALADFAEAARFVRDLRELGCRVALDDFGAGFTSLRHLRGLELDMVKVDGAFVRDLARNPATSVFLRHVIGLANACGLATVAECVETSQDMTLLQAVGVDMVQGWHIGRPSVTRPWASASEVAAAAL